MKLKSVNCCLICFYKVPNYDMSTCSKDGHLISYNEICEYFKREK